MTTIKLTRELVTCDDCDGKGTRYMHPLASRERECEICRGAGVIAHYTRKDEQ